MNYIQVVSPPTTIRLVSLQKVKQELEINDSSQDSFLNSLINEASSLIKEYTEREFGIGEYIEYVKGENTQNLILTHYPIQEVKYVKELGREIPPEMYMVIKDKGILFSSYGWGASYLMLKGTITMAPAGYVQFYEVRYKAGYVLPEDTQNTGDKLPEAIERVCLDIVKILYNSRKKDDSIQSERLGDYSVTFKDSKLGELLSLLDRFKRTI